MLTQSGTFRLIVAEEWRAGSALSLEGRGSGALAVRPPAPAGRRRGLGRSIGRFGTGERRAIRDRLRAGRRGARWGARGAGSRRDRGPAAPAGPARRPRP